MIKKKALNLHINLSSKHYIVHCKALNKLLTRSMQQIFNVIPSHDLTTTLKKKPIYNENE